MSNKLVLAARILLGAIFLIFGLNAIFMFIPMPAPVMSDQGTQLMGAFVAVGYFIPLLKAVEIICGFCLVVGVFVPLSLVVLAPVIIQILFFHLFLAPGGLLLAVVLAVLELSLLWSYRDSYRSLLKMR